MQSFTPEVTVVWLPVCVPPPNLVMLCCEAPFNLVMDLWRTSLVGSKLAAPELEKTILIIIYVVFIMIMIRVMGLSEIGLINLYLLFPVLSPELPLPIGKLSRVILLWDVGKRPVDREEAAPTPEAELIVVPTVVDVELDGTIPTPMLPNIAFWATILLRWIFCKCIIIS